VNASVGRADPVLMISVDGMKPEYVFEADARGLKIPYLRRRLAEGAYATGVVGVWPTVTYPSHTTLVTGVAPAEHGIFTNLEFDPEREFKDAWFWYARQIRVPTLWDAAHAAGLVTASVGWPVTVGSAHVDWLIPEYWRTSGPPKTLNPFDRELIGALARPDGLLDEMRQADGDYMNGNDTSIEGDLIKTKYAIDILRHHKPRFMTVHLSSLDEAEHAHGVFSEEANAVLEKLDAQLAALAEAARANDPASIVAIVSDHGFMTVSHWINLNVAFQQAGLLAETRDPATSAMHVTSWKAQPWLAGGMAAVMLHDPDDRATAEVVGALLQSLAANPVNGIAAIKNADDLKRVGAFPGATYLVVFQPGYYAGAASTGDLITDLRGPHGGHGFSPDYPEMRASFFIDGRAIARNRNLGVIDMRQIAPTLARLMGVDLPSSQAVRLSVQRDPQARP
jgi:predicted AlkP superfamily pyrophosphatase or phosphodiesterase